MNKSIYSPKGTTNSVCCKIPYKGYEISIAMHDTCGVLENYSRGDICVYREYDDKDVTEELFVGRQSLPATAAMLKYIFAQIDMFGDRD